MYLMNLWIFDELVDISRTTEIETIPSSELTWCVRFDFTRCQNSAINLHCGCEKVRAPMVEVRTSSQIQITTYRTVISGVLLEKER